MEVFDPDMKRVKFTACIMAVLMLFYMLIMFYFVASHADHDCKGEDCPICACIHQCENNIRGMGNAAITATAVLIPFCAALLSMSLGVLTFISDTPVSRKVRLDN